MCNCGETSVFAFVVYFIAFMIGMGIIWVFYPVDDVIENLTDMFSKNNKDEESDDV